MRPRSPSIKAQYKCLSYSYSFIVKRRGSKTRRDNPRRLFAGMQLWFKIQVQSALPCFQPSSKPRGSPASRTLFLHCEQSTSLSLLIPLMIALSCHDVVLPSSMWSSFRLCSCHFVLSTICFGKQASGFLKVRVHDALKIPEFRVRTDNGTWGTDHRFKEHLLLPGTTMFDVIWLVRPLVLGKYSLLRVCGRADTHKLNT